MLFIELSRRSLQRYFAYRIAALAGLVTNLFFGLVRAGILVALYGAREEVAGLTVAQAITYTGLTQAVFGYLNLMGWYGLMDSVHRGDVASDLLKPMNFFGFWLAQDFGRALAGLLLRGITIMLVYAVLFDIVVPSAPLQWVALVVSLALAWLVNFSWLFLVNLSAFWTTNARGVGRLGFTLGLFFSGFLMPLRFFPDWVQNLAFLTPFPHTLNTTVEVYLGTVVGVDLLGALASQALWAAGLIVLGQLTLRRAVRRLVILGG